MVLQAEMRKYEPCSLVNRIVSTVTITQLRSRESVGKLLDQLLDSHG
jgi:tRNA isopentenyl-2-thiomethyl-A-37 hydroxylase MiaE